MLPVRANSKQTRITHSTVTALKQARVRLLEIVAFSIPINCFVTHTSHNMSAWHVSTGCAPNYQGVYSQQYNINITLDITLLIKTYSTPLHGREL